MVREVRVRACCGEVHGGGVAHRAEQPPHAPLQRETGSFLRRSCAATGQGTQRSLISAAKLWFDIHSARELWKPTCPCGSAAPSLFPSLVAGCKVRTFSRGPAGFCARARQVWVEAFADAGVQSRLWRPPARWGGAGGCWLWSGSSTHPMSVLHARRVVGEGVGCGEGSESGGVLWWGE